MEDFFKTPSSLMRVPPFLPPPNPPGFYQPPPGTWNPPLELLAARRASQCRSRNPSPTDRIIDLIVSNLDPSIPIEELQEILTDLFKRVAVDVSYLEVMEFSYGAVGAFVQLNSLEDARRIITTLQRKKVGQTRILISTRQLEDHNVLMGQVQSESHGPFLPPIFPLNDDLTNDEFCPLHFSREKAKDLASDPFGSLPHVLIRLADLETHMKILLKSHGGSLPLLSLVSCYNTEIEHGLKPDPDWGVPLEHLVSSIPGISITQVPNKKFKRVNLLESSSSFLDNNLRPPEGVSKHILELLKSSPKAVMPMASIPGAFWNFVGVPLVSDLEKILEELSDVFQVLGCGPNSSVTLTHAAQVSRFTEDIRSILIRSKGTIYLKDLPRLYRAELGRPMCIQNYGVSCIQDILKSVPPESQIYLKRGLVPSQSVLSLLAEKEGGGTSRRHVFANEVLELLRFAPEAQITLGKFAPLYAQHYGRDVRLGEYGYNKLVELMESIPWAVELKGRAIVPVPEELLDIVGEQICSTVWENMGVCTMEVLQERYEAKYGHGIQHTSLGASSSMELILKLEEMDILDVIYDKGVEQIYLSRKLTAATRVKHILDILVDNPGGRMTMKDFCDDYSFRYNVLLDIEDVLLELKDWLESSIDANGIPAIGLKPYKFCLLNLQMLLMENSGYLCFNTIESLYAKRFLAPLSPSALGFPSLPALLKSFASEHLETAWKRSRSMVLLVPKGELLSISLSCSLAEGGGSLVPLGFLPTFSFPVEEEEDEFNNSTYSTTISKTNGFFPPLPRQRERRVNQHVGQQQPVNGAGGGATSRRFRRFEEGQQQQHQQMVPRRRRGGPPPPQRRVGHNSSIGGESTSSTADEESPLKRGGIPHHNNNNNSLCGTPPSCRVPFFIPPPGHNFSPVTPPMISPFKSPPPAPNVPKFDPRIPRQAPLGSIFEEMSSSFESLRISSGRNDRRGK